MVSETPTDGRCNAELDAGYCEGWQMDNGRCWSHGGRNEDDTRDPGGAPENNGNAEKHALSADPKKYHERQTQADKEWIRDISATIEDRIRRVRGTVDPLDRVLARRIAIKLHIAAKASEYVDDTGLVQEIFVEDGGYMKEIPNAIVTELRNYDREIMNELQKLDLVGDPQKAGEDGARVITLLSETANE